MKEEWAPRAQPMPCALAAKAGSFAFRAGGRIFFLSSAVAAKAVKTESHRDPESTTGNNFWLWDLRQGWKRSQNIQAAFAWWVPFSRDSAGTV